MSPGWGVVQTLRRFTRHQAEKCPPRTGGGRSIGDQRGHPMNKDKSSRIFTASGLTAAQRTADGVAKARAKRKLRDERLQSEFAIGILRGLGADKSKHVYGGTVDPVTVQERRAKNRQARTSRQINRRRGA